MANSEYNLTVVDGTALTISLSGPVGPAGAGGGSSTISTSTLTTLTGYIYGNGTTIVGATAATSANTANTLVKRDAYGTAGFYEVWLEDSYDGALNYIRSDNRSFELGPNIGLNPNARELSFVNIAAGSTQKSYIFPNVSGTVALTNQPQNFTAAQVFSSPSVSLSTIPVYANNGAASSLPDGSIYRTSTGELRVKYT